MLSWTTTYSTNRVEEAHEERFIPNFKGRSTGEVHHPERHLAGADLEEDGTDGPSEQTGRGIMDHSSQLHDHSQMVSENQLLQDEIVKLQNELRRKEIIKRKKDRLIRTLFQNKDRKEKRINNMTSLIK